MYVRTYRPEQLVVNNLRSVLLSGRGSAYDLLSASPTDSALAIVSRCVIVIDRRSLQWQGTTGGR